MIRNLTIQGLGPHLRELDLAIREPYGHTTIAGHSQAGKSSLIDAVAFALLGEDRRGDSLAVECIHEELDKARVELVTESGSRVARSKTNRNSVTRQFTGGDGSTRSCGSEEELRKCLGPIGAKPLAARVVLAPMAWQRLLEEDMGRKLRQLILDLGPDSAEATRGVMSAAMAKAGLEMRADDPTDIKACEAKQTASNRAHAEAKGALDAAKALEVATRETVQRPAPEAVTVARQVSELAQVWAQHEQAAQVYRAKLAAHKQAEVARDDWRKRKAAMGERPTYDAAAVQAAQLKVDKLGKEMSAAQSEIEMLSKDFARIKAQIESAKAAKDCPTCHRPLEQKIDLSALESDLADALDHGKQARVRFDKATAEHKAAFEALRPLKDAAGAAAAWDAAQRALGSEPAVPAPPTEPKQPGQPRPEPAQVSAAALTLQQEERAAGAQERASAQRAQAEQALAKAVAAEQRTRVEADRVVALLAAARNAPGEILAQALDALQNDGIQLRVPPKESGRTPAVEALIDGRPWWLASDGRLVVADLQFRAKFRKYADLDALTILVDRAQDWSDPWPELEGPVWYFVTQPGEMVVRDGVPGGA